jgi:two-component system osmolarity sensor histidine kinase EnvZ
VLKGADSLLKTGQAVLKRGETGLRRVMPRSLLGRSLLIIVTPLILLQVVAAIIFYERHWQTISWRLSSALAGEIASIVEALDQYPGPENLDRIRDMAYRNMGLSVTVRPGADLPASEAAGDSLLERTLARALNIYVRRPFVIDSRPRIKEVEVQIQLADGVLVVNTSSKRLFSSTTYIFVLWMVGTSLVLFAVATLFMRNQVRSVRRLAEAADSFGKGHEVPDFKPEGAAEVRMAAAAFKLMRARIERQMSQRTEMLAGVSHDLGTVLTRLKLELAMLGDSAAVSALGADVTEMEKMVAGYLSFARGESTEEVEETDLSRLIAEVVAGFRRNGADVALDMAEGVTVPLRRASFKRCLTNLLTNATRHARHSWVAAAPQGNIIEILVDDDGPGIPETQREAVFKPFFRLDASRNLETGGVGLGLTIARDVVRRHGGDISLADSPRGGLRVSLRLPL